MREINNQMSPLQPLRDQHPVGVPQTLRRGNNKIAIPDGELMSVMSDG